MNKRDQYVVLPSKMVFGLSLRFRDLEVMFTNRKGKGVPTFREFEQTKKIDFLLKDVVKTLEEMQYNIKFPVEVVDFHNKDILGKADIDENKIYISWRAFDMGRRQIAEILIEEQEHINTHNSDETRAFQNRWINLFLSEKEERFGIFL